MKTRKTIMMSLALGLSLAGMSCTSSDQPRKTGSYAAARKMQVGSNIPQPYNADSRASTINEQELERAGNQQSMSSMNAMQGGAH
jgi:hypothetical protein